MSVERQKITAARLAPVEALNFQTAQYFAALKAWRARPVPGSGDMNKSVYDSQGIEAHGYRVEYKTDYLDIGLV